MSPRKPRGDEDRTPDPEPTPELDAREAAPEPDRSAVAGRVNPDAGE